MKNRLIWMVVITLSLLLAGCQSNSYKNQYHSGFQQIKLGQNAVQEECWAETGSMVNQSVYAAHRIFNIYCGEWEWPSARLFEVIDASPELEAWLDEDGEWLETLQVRMQCPDYNHLAIHDDIDAVLLNCKLNNGGWPYLALVTSMGNSTYLADGIPASLISIEKLIATLQNKQDEPAGMSPSPAISYINKLFKDRLYRAKDLDSYYWSMMLGQYYNSIKAFSKAQKQYEKALVLHEKVLGPDNSETVDARMHIALELSNQEQFIQAEQLFRKVEDKIDGFANQTDYARFKSYYAIHAANQGLFSEALKLAQEATTTRRSLIGATGLSWNVLTGPVAEVSSTDGRLILEDERTQSVELAHSLYIEAAMQECLDELVGCDQVLDKARFIVSAAGDAPPLWKPQLVNLDGLVEESRGYPVKAEKAYLAAMRMFESHAPQERPTALSRIDLGKAHYNNGRLAKALSNFKEAINLIRKNNQSLSVNQLAPYFNLILKMASVQPDNQEELFREMFNAAQLVRSGLTAQDIAKTVARFSEGEDEAGHLIGRLQEEEQARIRNRQQSQVLLGNILERDYLQRLDKLNRELDVIDKRMASLSQQVQQLSPRYQQFISSPVTLEDVVSVLGPEEGLLKVLIGKKQSFVFFLHKGRLQAYSVDTPQSFVVDKITKIHKYLKAVQTRKPKIVKEGDIGIASPTYQLYTSLLSPISDQINHVSHLITVPSGPLLNLPFGLLLTKQPPSKTENISTSEYLSQLAWLAKQVDISLVPSTQSFVYLRRLTAASQADKSLLAFGGFVSEHRNQFDDDIHRLNICISDRKDILPKLNDLPGSNKEVYKVSKLFSPGDTDIYLGFAFNELRVKQQKLDDYRILYFATHTLLPDEKECWAEPSLVTSLRVSSPGNEDGLLTSQEIQDFKLDADLVVLSACNTGSADKLGGESLSGLARSFFFAGARSLLVSHWKVDDIATADLMVRFFKELKSGESISLVQALRRAQTELIDESQDLSWSHPFYWAAFTLVGDGSLKMAEL